MNQINEIAAKLAHDSDIITYDNLGRPLTTNGIESVFAVLKRGLHGVYHHASPKHLHRYVGEFAFRLGDGDVSRHTMERLASLFSAAIGKRLTYAELIA